MNDPNLLQKHILINKDDWKFLQNLIKKTPSVNSFTDVIHLIIQKLKANQEESKALELLQQLRIQLSSISKDVSMGNHMVGELFYINDLQFVRHGVTPEIKTTAMKLVDKDIKNAQERKNSKHD
ncbi:hypothetical protein PT287_09850 [Lactobacillus sp. ESL0679]|uniref:hypothetical protein n=1 Tax=Lactobacillus sp. ESL0679 TaxID=2983209 RepID=UPI0023F7548A|nr:hypothetical protein [Lactobacillus sp. ESL0679]MDF7683801.1 hypothetical protein [Lactobacillus sp. ESL0679]